LAQWFDHDEARDHPNPERLRSDQGRATLEQKRVDELAASILDKGLLAPILVRADGGRFVLVEGLHRLEAAKALGEETIVAFLVDARKR
jgi:ParB-like chromosome segregation protein Spo0J